MFSSHHYLYRSDKLKRIWLWTSSTFLNLFFSSPALHNPLLLIKDLRKSSVDTTDMMSRVWNQIGFSRSFMLKWSKNFALPALHFLAPLYTEGDHSTKRGFKKWHHIECQWITLAIHKARSCAGRVPQSATTFQSIIMVHIFLFISRTSTSGGKAQKILRIS